MANLYVVGHGINTQGIFEDENAANQAAQSLQPVVINNTTVRATVLTVDSDRYEIDREKGIVIEKNGGNTAYLNDTIENNKW